METLVRPLEVKFAGGDAVGTFEGYGAFFNNIDGHGDVIVKGAFADTLRAWKSKNTLPPMLVQHGGWMMTDADAIPVGKWLSMSEDDNGLHVKGKLINLDTERGKQIYGAMREGVLNGLSIGYSVKDYSPGKGETRRTLKRLDLMEVSIVTFPANDKARVQSVKAADVKTVRDFEEFLKASGFSRNAAKSIAVHGFRPGEQYQDDELADLIKSNIAALRS